MNDETRGRLSVVIVAMIGIGMTIYGMVEHWNAMDSGDAFEYIDSGIRMIFGCFFVLISLVMKIWIDGFMKIKKMRQEQHR